MQSCTNFGWPTLWNANNMNARRFGYNACAEIPSSSRRFRRATASNAAGSASAWVGGNFGGNSFQPAIAKPDTPVSLRSPTTQRSSWRFSSNTTRGATSAHFGDNRFVHRSGGSLRWLSTSMMGIVTRAPRSAGDRTGDVETDQQVVHLCRRLPGAAQQAQISQLDLREVGLQELPELLVLCHCFVVKRVPLGEFDS